MLKVNDVSASPCQRHPEGRIDVKRFLEVSYQFVETTKKCSFGFSYEGLHKIHCLIVLNCVFVSAEVDTHQMIRSNF